MTESDEVLRFEFQESIAVATRVEKLQDGHDYVLAAGTKAYGSGICVVHAAGCRKCEENRH